MRDRSSWYRPIAKELSGPWRAEQVQERTGAPVSLLCQVELGLRLQQHLAPEEAVDGIWTLLGGYPFARAAGLIRGHEDERMLTAARHLLWTLRRRHAWLQSLEIYRDVPERLRGYRIPDKGGPAHWVEPAVAGNTRLDVYDAALSALPDFARRELPIAGPGESQFIQRRRWTSADLPETLHRDSVPGHSLSVPSGAGGRKQPIEVPLAELAETAEWMDKAEAADPTRRPGGWAARFRDLYLDARTGLRFEETQVLRIDRMLHMVGMVGAGKTTLMVLLAVWAARKGMRTTLVVGDVAEQLRLTELFRSLFDDPGSPPIAAPIMGGSTRERHVQRLHRRRAAQGEHSLLTHDDPAFDHLSTVCVVDALRGTDAAEPLRYVDAPCTGLYPHGKPTESESHANGSLPAPYRDSDAERRADKRDSTVDEPSGPAHGCPLWSTCPRHSAARELVDALIWVANPASLVQTRVPDHLNTERLRYLELAAVSSDILIVDEADRVQIQLDNTFAPSATLVTRGPDSWLDQLHTHNIGELARQGRLPLSEQDVERWATSLDVVSSATNRLYAMLIGDGDLRDWAEIEYFSAWTLQEKLLNEWYPPTQPSLAREGLPRESDVYDDDDTMPAGGDPDAVDGADNTPWAHDRRRVTEAFDAFRDDPLGGNGPHSELTDGLIRLAQDLLHTLNEKKSLASVRTFLDKLLADSPAAQGTLPTPESSRGAAPDPADIPGSTDWLERTAQRLAFTLRIAALHHRLDRLTFLWPQVEAALRLDSTDNELHRRPPLDYAPIVPEAPMGNIIGFQYLIDDTDGQPAPDGRRTGTLRFFRCAGVGRELLLSLPDLGADPDSGRYGPNVMLMSGTSWAGKSTRAHLTEPVGAVLRPEEASVEGVRNTAFDTRFVYEGGTPLKLSGQDQAVRPKVLRTIVGLLAQPRRGGVLSPMEEELQRIGDPNRRRALLLVSSYKDAANAADRLEEIERWRGRVRALVPDDAEVGPRGEAPHDPAGHRDLSAAPVRRGDLADFADDPDAELLVAPLLAVERGHNILNVEHKAAFGTMLFLARPHPRPDDLSLSVLAINDWATRFVRDIPDRNKATFSDLVARADGLDAAGLEFRNTARGEWRRLLSRRYIYSRLRPDEKASFNWDQLVTIWQVVGRLVRGGVPARVVFVDAAFAPEYAAATAPGTDPDVAARARAHGPKDGLLAGMREILDPYFAETPDPSTFTDPADPELVKNLYRPLYEALCGMAASGSATAATRPLET